MPKELMSDEELRRRKRLQAALSQTTGTLGLGALAGTMVASRQGRKYLRKIPTIREKGFPHLKAAPPKDPNRDRIKGGITPVLATGAGIGGIGAFNFAAYTKAEGAKKKQATKKKTVTKGLEDGMDMGYFGEEGHPITLPAIPTTEIFKAWEPVASNFDSERSRHKRSRVYEQAAFGGAGGAGFYAGHQGVKAARAGGKAKKAKKVKVPKPSSEKVVRVEDSGKPGTKPTISHARGNFYEAIPKEDFKAHQKASEANAAAKQKAIKMAGKSRKLHGRNAAIGAGIAGLGLGTGVAIRHKREGGSFASYSKRDSVSAFGIDHSH